MRHPVSTSALGFSGDRAQEGRSGSLQSSEEEGSKARALVVRTRGVMLLTPESEAPGTCLRGALRAPLATRFRSGVGRVGHGTGGVFGLEGAESAGDELAERVGSRARCPSCMRVERRQQLAGESECDQHCVGAWRSLARSSHDTSSENCITFSSDHAGENRIRFSAESMAPDASVAPRAMRPRASRPTLCPAPPGSPAPTLTLAPRWQARGASVSSGQAANRFAALCFAASYGVFACQQRQRTRTQARARMRTACG